MWCWNSSKRATPRPCCGHRRADGPTPTPPSYCRDPHRVTMAVMRVLDETMRTANSDRWRTVVCAMCATRRWSSVIASCSSWSLGLRSSKSLLILLYSILTLITGPPQTRSFVPRHRHHLHHHHGICTWLITHNEHTCFTWPICSCYKQPKTRST